jgi:hypothetical protein
VTYSKYHRAVAKKREKMIQKRITMATPLNFQDSECNLLAKERENKNRVLPCTPTFHTDAAGCESATLAILTLVFSKPPALPV